jgi:ribonuclease BN (tRNA processing enzyme)
MYGGNTSCVEVEADGYHLVLDAGSGIQHIVPSEDAGTRRIDILLTHLHMDHIQGLGVFKPLFDPSAEVHIWGPASSAVPLRARLGRFFSPPLFPVYFRNLSCNILLHEIGESSFNIGPFAIQSSYVMHPGPTIGLRIRHGGSTVAYLPDHEPALGTTGMLTDLNWLSGSDLALGADLLIHDAQYSSEEYEMRRGWGHSSMRDAIQFAELTGAKHLLLTHHDPMHTDAVLDEMFDDLKKDFPGAVRVQMAVEGTTLEV